MVAANLAAFSVLSVAVLRDVERRRETWAAAQERVRDTVVRQVADLFVSFLGELDFERDQPPRRLLGKEYWEYARDAYITDTPYRVGGRPQAGEIEINPLGAPDPEAQARRRAAGALELVERAYATGRPQYQGESVAIPLFSIEADARLPWGAAYVWVRVPALDAPPPAIDLPFVAAALGGGTLVGIGVIFLLLHVVVLKPLGQVAAGARRVSAGDLSTPVPETGRDDEIAAFVATFNRMMAEISQQRGELERRVAEAVERARSSEQRLVLAERLAAMGTLAAGIAHEINNPLGGMLNAVQSLRRRGAPPGSDRYLALIEDGLGRIREVVRLTLRFSPAQRSAATVRLHELVDDAARFVRHRFARAGARLFLDVPADLEVRGDGAALGQVLLNLLTNALDALADPPREVRIRAAREGDAVLLAVADTGVGMGEEVLRRAFDLFFTTKPAGAGTGLGLSIAHQIVQHHDGTMTIRSEPGRGTEVVVRLPAR